MTWIEAFKSAFRSLAANKLRSALTMLGIIIGVAAVIALMTLGRGMEAFITGQIEGIGANLVILIPGNPQAENPPPRRLTNADVEALADRGRVPSAARLAPIYTRGEVVVAGGRSFQTTVLATVPEYAPIRNFQIARGRFLTARDLEENARVAVLGANAAQVLFPEVDPVGERIRIRNALFEVVGVLAPYGGSFGSNADDQIFIPLSTAQNRLYRIRGRRVEVEAVFLQAVDADHVESLVEEATRVLRESHRLTYQDNDFSFIKQSDILRTFGIITTGLTIFLSAIAAISLVVGGIGIMNIMLVSVTERTREIGLRKAVGARRRDILSQFLIEAVTLSVIGGSVGIVLGYGLAFAGGQAVRRFAGTALPLQVQAGPILLAVGFSALVGILFGIYPAWRAAQLHPIEALRYE